MVMYIMLERVSFLFCVMYSFLVQPFVKERIAYSRRLLEPKAVTSVSVAQ